MKNTSPIHRSYIPRSLYDAARLAGAPLGLSPARYIVRALKTCLWLDGELSDDDRDVQRIKEHLNSRPSVAYLAGASVAASLSGIEGST